MARIVMIGLLVGGFANPSTVTAQDVTGAGASSCGTMLTALDNPDATLGDISRIGYRQWLQGYLSGLNAPLADSSNVPVDLDDPEGEWLWLKQYCEDNPLDSVWVGADALWKELRSRQGI